jgi:hypothetical protein
MKLLDALKSIRDAAAAKLAAQPVDDVPTNAVANNIVTLRPKSAKRIKPVVVDDAPPTPPASMPLVITASWHTAQSISHEFDGDPRFDAEAATRQWRQDQTKEWRDSNSRLPRKDRGAP